MGGLPLHLLTHPTFPFLMQPGGDFAGFAFTATFRIGKDVLVLGTPSLVNEGRGRGMG